MCVGKMLVLMNFAFNLYYATLLQQKEQRVFLFLPRTFERDRVSPLFYGHVLRLDRSACISMYTSSFAKT